MLAIVLKRTCLIFFYLQAEVGGDWPWPPRIEASNSTRWRFARSEQPRQQRICWVHTGMCLKNATCDSLAQKYDSIFSSAPIIRVSAWARRPTMWPTWTWLRAWRSAWRTAATWPTRATPTSAPRTATAATTGARTPASATRVNAPAPRPPDRPSFVLIFVDWASLLTVRSPSRRLFREGVRGCLPAQPLRARFYLREEAELLARLHLRMWTELLRPVLWKQVRSISLCKSTGRILLVYERSHGCHLRFYCCHLKITKFRSCYLGVMFLNNILCEAE